MSAGKGYVDVSTVDAATSQQVAAAVRGAGALFLEAPVSGSKGPAEQGALIFLTGGGRGACSSRPAGRAGCCHSLPGTALPQPAKRPAGKAAARRAGPQPGRRPCGARCWLPACVRACAHGGQPRRSLRPAAGPQATASCLKRRRRPWT
jgi:hypothetical protein